MARERFAAPGRDLSTDFRRLRLTNFLAFWGQQSRSVNVGEGTCTRMIQSRHTWVICSAGGLSETARLHCGSRQRALSKSRPIENRFSEEVRALIIGTCRGTHQQIGGDREKKRNYHVSGFYRCSRTYGHHLEWQSDACCQRMLGCARFVGSGREPLVLPAGAPHPAQMLVFGTGRSGGSRRVFKGSNGCKIVRGAGD